MSKDQNTFNSYVIKGILSENNFGITEVIGLKEIKAYNFSPGIYQQIKQAIQNRNLNDLFGGSIKEEKSAEYLFVMSFKDEHQRNYTVVVYDSDELWQNPEVFEIFPF